MREVSNSMTRTYYDILGISDSSSEDDIKRAIARRRRQMEVDNDQDGIKTLSHIKSTLMDYEQRKVYDVILKYGDVLSDLNDSITRSFEAKEWEKAKDLLKKAIIIAPIKEYYKNQLAMCYIYSEEFISAIKILQGLTKSAPLEPLYWFNLGYGNLLAYQSHSQSNSVYLTNSRACFLKAIELESVNSEPYMAMARSFFVVEEYDKAILWANKALHADGKWDVYDTDIVVYIAVIEALRNRFGGIRDIAKRFYENVSDSEEREYVSRSFARESVSMLTNGYCAAADELAKVALLYNSGNEDIKSLQKHTQLCRGLEAEIKQINADERILQPFKCISTLFAIREMGNDISEYEEDYQNAVDSIGYYDAIAVMRSIDYLKGIYPNMYTICREIYTEIYKIAKSRNASCGNHVSQSSSNGYNNNVNSDTNNSGAGCAGQIIGAIIGGIIGSLIFPGVGTIIGIIIGSNIGGNSGGSS